MTEPNKHDMDGEPLPLDIEVEQVKRLLDSDEEFLLIDCREVDEHEFCRIDGARLIPMNEIPHRVEELELYSDRPIIFHCHHGGRSFQIVQWLRSQGFDTAQNMNGGIEAWSKNVDPSVPRY